MSGILQVKYVAGIGIILSIYAYYVETQSELDSDYEALCDINEHISCTKVFSSKYGKGFGIIGLIFGENSILNQPNGLTGIFFYILLAILDFSKNLKIVKFQTILCGISNMMSLYLAYLLYYVLEDFCIVCVTTYLVNFICLMVSIKKYKYLLEENVKLKNN